MRTSPARRAASRRNLVPAGALSRGGVKMEKLSVELSRAEFCGGVGMPLSYDQRRGQAYAGVNPPLR